METDWRPALLLHIAAVPIWAWIVATPVLLYLAWLLPRLRRFQLMNRIPNPLPSKWLIGNTMELANLPRVRHSGKPDTLSLFISLSDRALSSGNGLFRLHFFRFIPFLSREWVFVADYQLAKELLSQDNYGNFDKGNFCEAPLNFCFSTALALSRLLCLTDVSCRPPRQPTHRQGHARGTRRAQLEAYAQDCQPRFSPDHASAGRSCRRRNHHENVRALGQ